MKKTTLNKVAASVLTSVALFTGCGSSQDGEIISSYGGKVVDGYVAGATVYYEGHKDEAVVTDEEGSFSLKEYDAKLIVETNSSTTNMATYATYNGTMSAPAGYSVVTPLTTVLATNSAYGEKIAQLISTKEKNISASELKTYLDTDPIALMDDTNETISNLGATIYGKGVFLEKAVDLVMADSNNSDLDKKEYAIKAMFDYFNEQNKTLVDLDSVDYEAIYTTFKGSPSEVTKKRVGIVGNNLSANLSELKFNKKNSTQFEIDLAQNDLIGMVTQTTTVTDDELSEKTSAVTIGIGAGITAIENNETNETLALLELSAQKIADDLDVGSNNAPSVTMESYISIDKNESNKTVELTYKDENNSTVTYTAVIDDNNFLTFDDGKKTIINKKGDSFSLKVNRENMIGTNGVKISVTPKDSDNIVGETKTMFVLVYKDNTNRSLLRELEIGENNFSTPLTIEANENYVLDDENKTITYEEPSTTNNRKILYVDSNDTKVAKAIQNGTNNLTITPVYNGTAEILKITMDDNYDVNISKKNITIVGMDLPPIMSSTTKSKKTVSKADSYVNVEFPYTIKDPDGDETSLSITENNDINCSFDNTKITCSVAINSEGIYKFTATANDKKLDGNSITYTIDVQKGDVAPDLSLLSNPTLTMDAMTTTSVSYIASDLNGDDTFDLNATSSDETIAKVSLDEVNKKLKIVAQPKVGTTTISMYAEDNTSMKSETKTIVVTTVNKMDTLVSSLRVVPAVDENNTKIYDRYSISNFSASYSIAANSIAINGNVSGENNYTVQSFTLDADPDEAAYGGVAHSEGYAFILSNGFLHEGQFKDGRVLALSTQGEDGNATTPYIWALATQSEICAAYGTNTDMLTLINNANANSVTCSE